MSVIFKNYNGRIIAVPARATKAVQVSGYFRYDPRAGRVVWVNPYTREGQTKHQARPPMLGKMPRNFPDIGEKKDPLATQTDDEMLIVNLTAFREPGTGGVAHTPKQTYEQLNAFVKALEEDPDIDVLLYKPVLGAWEGGAEPSSVIVLDGDDEKISQSLVAAARQWRQDAFIVSKINPQSNRKTYFFHIKNSLGPKQRKVIENVLVAHGIGGWTWMRDADGNITLNVHHLPEWGTNLDDAKADDIIKTLKNLGFDVNWDSTGIDLKIYEYPYM